MSERHRRVDSCDVVVVGAGLVGAAVATYLAREKFDTAVLEAQTIAEGATGRSAGMVLAGLAGHYNWAVSAYGRQKAQEIWGLTAEGRERLIEAAGWLQVPVERTGSLALAVEDAEADALRESAVLMQEDGFEARFNPRDPLDRGFCAAMRQPEDATVDAAALTRALLSSEGIVVHERTEVNGLEQEQGGVRVWAQGRTVLCNSVVLAVNGYAPLLDEYFTDKIAPTRSLVLAGAPLGSTMLAQPCSVDYGYEYCRQLPDRRLLLGGWRRPRKSDQGADQETELDDVVKDGLTRFAARHFSDIDMSSVDQWSGIMGFTPDGLPLVGRLAHLPQVYFAVGLGGRGLAWAFVVAERVVDMMMHGSDAGIVSASRLA